MELLMMELMEFLIELLVVTAGVWLVAIGLSFAFLYASRLYQVKGFTVGTPLVIACAFSLAGAIGSGSLRTWALFYLLSPALSAMTISSHFRKRLQQTKAESNH